MHGMTEIMKKTSDGVKAARLIDDGEEWHAEMMRKMRAAPKGIYCEVCIITPSRAKALLARNPDNRTLSQPAINNYMNDIAEGRYVFNGQPIIIANTGELNDGQHRCEAVLQGGVNLECLVEVGPPRASRMTVDIGKARRVADFVSMFGIENPTIVAAIAAIVLTVETGGSLGKARASYGIADNVRPTKQAVLTYARANLPEIRQALDALPRKECAQVSTWSRFAAFLILISRKCRDFETAKEFVLGVAVGENLQKGSAMFAARAKLLSERKTRALPMPQEFEILIRCWNAYREGRSLSVVPIKNNWPEISG